MACYGLTCFSPKWHREILISTTSELIWKQMSLQVYLVKLKRDPTRVESLRAHYGPLIQCVCVCVCVCVRIHVWICIHCAAKGVECSCYDWPRPKLDQQNSFFWESRTLNQGNIKFGSFDSDSLQWSRQKVPELLCYNQSLNPPWYPALLEAGKVHLFLESPKVSNPVFVLPASIFIFLKQTGVCLQNNHG